MKFEQPKKPEQAERPPIERMESGELTKLEREVLNSLLERQKRYGTQLDLMNYDPETKKPLDIWTNFFLEMDIIDRRLDSLRSITHAIEFEKLPSSKKELYFKLRSGDEKIKEELEKEGLADLNPEDIFKASDLEDMPQEDLEKLMREVDSREALAEIQRSVLNPMTGDKIPDEKEDPLGYDAAVLELTNFYTNERHAYQEAAKLQLEYDVFVNGSDHIGAEYLRRVKERIGL